MEWVRGEACCSPAKLHGGTMHAHHAGYHAALSQKPSDRTCIPLCWFCHSSWHSGAYPFAGWTKEARRVWSDYMIGIHNRAYDDLVLERQALSLVVTA